MLIKIRQYILSNIISKMICFKVSIINSPSFTFDHNKISVNYEKIINLLMHMV